MCEPGWFPDGWTESLIDALLAEVDGVVEPVARSVSPFASAGLDVRRERRDRNRRLGLVSRLYPGGDVRGVAA